MELVEFKGRKGIWITYKGRKIFIPEERIHQRELGSRSRLDPKMKVLGGITLATLAAYFLKPGTPISELFRNKRFVVIAKHPNPTPSMREKFYDMITSAIMGMRVVRPKAGAKLPKTAGVVHTWSKEAFKMKLPKIQDYDLMSAIDDKAVFPKLFKDDPKIVPQTFLLREFHSLESARYAFQRAGKGFVIKPRIGSLSKELPTHEWSDKRLMKYIEQHGGPNNVIIQEMLPFRNEFRVHYVNGKVYSITHRRFPDPFRKIYNKIFYRFGMEGGSSIPVLNPVKRKRLKEFVTQAMKLYEKNAHVGFDIVELPDGSFRFIEGNPVPGSLMNPVIARKLHKTVTGVWTNDLRAVALAGGAAGLWWAGEGVSEVRKKEKQLWV
ncbi:hypothetical protein J7J18_06815 [bacterium]|nr:hypothetical protein [bacterium]